MKATVSIKCMDGETIDGELAHCKITIANESDVNALGIAIASALSGTGVARQLAVLARAASFINDVSKDDMHCDEEWKFIESSHNYIEYWKKFDDNLRKAVSQ